MSECPPQGGDLPPPPGGRKCPRAESGPPEGMRAGVSEGDFFLLEGLLVFFNLRQNNFPPSSALEGPPSVNWELKGPALWSGPWGTRRPSFVDFPPKARRPSFVDWPLGARRPSFVNWPPGVDGPVLWTGPGWPKGQPCGLAPEGSAMRTSHRGSVLTFGDLLPGGRG